MNALKTIISTFSTDESQRFVTFLGKKNRRHGTKNIQLFNLILNDDLSSKELCYKLYGKGNENAYHALRKRLYRSIIDFTANNSLEEENSVDMEIIKYILASRNFLKNRQFKAAYKVLNKAEQLAEEHHLFSLLNEIFHTQIQYAYAYPSVNIDSVIAKFEENKENHLLEDKLNIVYAKIRSSINKGEVNDFQTILDTTLAEYNIGLKNSMSFKSLYQLTTIVGISAFATNDYLNLEPFLLDTYKYIQNHKNKEKQLYYHIQILYLIANTLFRNKKLEQSCEYLNKMHEQMLAQKSKYYSTFKLKYHLLLALNYNYLNRQNEAIALLAPIIGTKHTDLESFLDIHLSLIMFYFQKNDLKKAYSLFSKFYHSDYWYTEKVGVEWLIKKNLMEILLHIELKNIDLAESRILSLKRHHSKYLKDIGQQRALTYLNLVEHYYKNPETVTSDSFKTKVKNSFKWIEAKKEDIFVMSFYAWLKSKMEQSDIFETTLALIKKAQLQQ